ncbi:hypothetical protein ABID95_007434 [Streptomyces atratus]
MPALARRPHDQRAQALRTVCSMSLRSRPSFFAYSVIASCRSREISPSPPCRLVGRRLRFAPRLSGRRPQSFAQFHDAIVRLVRRASHADQLFDGVCHARPLERYGRARLPGPGRADVVAVSSGALVAAVSQLFDPVVQGSVSLAQRPPELQEPLALCRLQQIRCLSRERGAAGRTDLTGILHAPVLLGLGSKLLTAGDEVGRRRGVELIQKSLYVVPRSPAHPYAV